MNLIKTITSPAITIITLILTSKTKYSNIKQNISKTAAILILIQTISLHTHTTNSKSHITIIFTSDTTIDNTKIISTRLTIDTLSTILMTLTALLILTSLLISEKTIYHTHTTLMLCLFTTLLILFLAFTTSSLINFYITFESSVIPLIIIIGLWGSRKEKIRATYYFLLYTITGSLPLFIAILILHNKTGTFNATLIQHQTIDQQPQLLLFLGLFLAFAIKTPLIPWHAWLPLAHVEAPAIGSILLAGILLKLGTYGFIRFTIPILTHTTTFIAPIIITISIISMWLASLNSLRQNDIKRIIAYSSIAHMGIITAACFSTNHISTKGAIILMISHGLTSSTLFLLVSCLYERHKSRLLKSFQGSSYTTPTLSSLTIIAALAHMSTPGTTNFIGEYLCLVGLWELHPSISIISIASIIITTAYLLLLYIQITSSKPPIYTKYKIQDLSRQEIQATLTLTTPNIAIGIIPYPII
uniref:NADH-ubiquinone oxidoreductase chain 4 n=1 Tax=Iphiteon panicea TaxID=436082 RepID=A6YHK2_9METZ|nr:NADH dehydrogenase subunit 4 [Iphiteon panicea]